MADLSPDLKALKSHIMEEIEAKLSLKEDSLWRRGQVEIRRLQQDQQEVLSCFGKLEERQAGLVSENAKIRGTLQKFELVVQEMREVLGTLVQYQSQRPAGQALQLSPSPSAASTAASEQVPQEDSAEPAERRSASMVIPVTKWQTGDPASVTSAAPSPLPAAEDLSGKTYCTPPRLSAAALAAEDLALGSGKLLPPPSWGTASTSSPAVLSLASVLLSSAGMLSPNPTPLKRIQLADCLEQTGPAASPTLAEAVMATPPARRPTGTASPTQSNEVVDFVSVELVKAPGFQTLGIEVNQSEGTLVVDSIDEHGLVGFHNSQQESDQAKICVGDRIIEVNGIKQGSSRILHECKVRQRLAMVLARAVPDCTEELSQPRRLRPEAQVFVPSTQKAPPGLERYDVGPVFSLPSTGSVSFLATTPQLLTGREPMGFAQEFVDEEPEVKRTLFS